jgi:putative ATPase
VYVLKPLTEEQIVLLLRNALADEERGLGKTKLRVSEDVLKKIASYSSGDARSAYNVLEVAAAIAKQHSGKETGAEITDEIVQDALQKRILLYDKAGEEHYNLISALHKSVRGSDPDAALYYLCRMLDGGEDRLFIARRLVRMAVEDIGLADPQALVIANAAKEAFDFLGSPEGELAIAEATVYMATAPKSNANYVAYKAAMRAAKEHGSLSPPKAILNAPTKLMEDEGYGSDYLYDHDQPDAFSGQNYFPDEFKKRPNFYDPLERGFEREIKKRLDYWAKLRAERNRRS